MRKFTFFLLSLMVAISTTAMAQIDTQKEYRIKNVATGLYLNAGNYDAHPTGPQGGVNVVAKADSDDQVFTLEGSGNSYKLKTKSGYYIYCQEWNVDALTNYSLITFEDAGNGEYYFKCTQGYFKVEDVGGVYYPFCNAGKAEATKWSLTATDDEATEEKPEPEAFAVVSQSPKADEAVESLSSITIEFSKNIEFIQAAGGNGGTGTDVGTGDTGTSGPAQYIKLMGANGIAATAWVNAATIDGNKVTFVFEGNAAITKAGAYTFAIPAGLIKSVDGEEFAGETFTFNVEEPTVEPEEPNTGLNETVVFDFTYNAWEIPGYDFVNFKGVKTAETYTDGAKSITINPTKNKGEFYYENNYLRISKPGSKIILPAFNFAVEKIEVVGHASATDYKNVDMNVYVGDNTVSTACIGSTATSTFEIAADKQAAGNIYELVIGENGGNYSSVMYITYIKVYPAENALEAPAFDPASGVYIGEQTVNVHSATADLEGVTNVTYYYTTDGNEPTVQDEETDGEIIIDHSCTLKVIVKLTYGDKTYVSASSSAEYIITEEVTFHRAVAVENGNYFLVANGYVSEPINGTTLKAKETTVSDNDVTEGAYYALTLEETNGNFYIKDANGNYISNTMMFPDKLGYSKNAPMDSWAITIADDENSTATISSNGAVIVYVDGEFKSVPESDVTTEAVYPTFYGVHATGIESVVTNGEAIESIYDLQGRKIEKITKGGIYIVNGKKLLVK